MFFPVDLGNVNDGLTIQTSLIIIASGIIISFYLLISHRVPGKMN